MMLSGEVTSTDFLVSVSNHCGTCVLTTADTSASSPATMHNASIACPKVMVRVLAPSLKSRCHVRFEVRVSTPLPMCVRVTDSTCPT